MSVRYLMKDIEVYLRLSSHPVFKYLTKYPPSGVKYNMAQKFTLSASSGLKKTLKRKAWHLVTRVRPPRVNIDSKKGLVHSCHGMLISNRSPWVVDVEHAPSFANYNIGSLQKPWYRNKIVKLLASDYCKKIMPWTKAAKISVENTFENKGINKKLEVVYPAVDIKDVSIDRDPSVVRFLVASRFFYEKGGKQALEAFEKLDKKYDVHITLLSMVPQEIKNKYSKFKNVEFVEKIFVNTERPDAIFEDYYSKHDILFNLTFADTFGLASLEAMSCSMPIIGTDMFSMPELIEDGKNGFTVRAPFSVLGADYSVKYSTAFGNMGQFMGLIKGENLGFVDAVVEKASILIEDTKLRNKMGAYGRKLVESGKFSINHRNKQLRRIYEDALK